MLAAEPVKVSAPLWPIVHFKRWILHGKSQAEQAAVAAYDCEVAALRMMSDYDPNHHLTSTPADKYGFRHTHPPLSRIIERWRHLVEARLFVEDAVNDELAATLQQTVPPTAAYHVHHIRPSTRYWKLQTCILRLELNAWAGECTRYLQLCETKRNEDDEVDSSLEMVDQLKRYQRFSRSIAGMHKIDPAPEMDGHPLKQIHEELQEMVEYLVARVADSHISIDKAVRFTPDQLHRLLKCLLDRHSGLSKERLLELLIQTTPDNTSCLLQLANDVASRLIQHDDFLLSYLLERQRGVFDAIPLVHNKWTLTMFDAIVHLTSGYFRERRPETNAMALLRQHRIRFSPDLSPGHYGRVVGSAEILSPGIRAPQTAGFHDQIYVMVEFGMPADVSFPPRSEQYLGEVPRASTLLERMILTLATGDRNGHEFYSNANDAVEVYRNFPQTQKTTVWRFLIAEQAPVPLPDVLKSLLKTCTLTVLFTTLYFLLRAGKRVVLPEINPRHHFLPWNRPAHYRKLAVIIRELLLRCGSDYPQSFLKELDRIAGCGVRRQTDTLQMSALRVVRRHLSPAAAPSSHPRMSLDNYMDVAGSPTFGELHFTRPPHPLIPTMLLAQLNLTDLMTAYQDAVAADGAVLFVDLTAQAGGIE